MAVITTNSIQSGAENIVSGDGTTIDITISTVVVANSIAMITSRNVDATGRAKRYMFASEITSTTNLRITREQSSFSGAVELEWTVVEFDTGVLNSIQTGTVDRTSSTVDTTITAVDVDKSFIIPQLKTNSDNLLGDVTFLAELTTGSVSGDTLTTRSTIAPTTGESIIDYQVVEFASDADVTVQAGTISVPLNNESATATITAVDTTKTFVIYAGVSISQFNSNTRCHHRVRLTNSTTVTTDRSTSGTASASEMSYFVVELEGSGHKVEIISEDIPDTNTAPSTQPTWTALSTTNTAFMGGWSIGNQRLDNSISGNQLEDSCVSVSINSGADGAILTRGGNSNVVSVISYAVDFSGGGGGGTLVADTGTYAYAGTDAGLLLDRIVAADTGTYSYAGADAVLTVGFNVAAESGLYSYVGTASGLLVDRSLGADSGSYGYTGTDAGLLVGELLGADSGTYSYTGTSSDLLVSSVIESDTGTYGYLGTAADLIFTSGNTLLANTGTYSYTGANSELLLSSLVSADSGIYSYSGADVDFNVSISAGSGSYAYSGANVTLTLGDRILVAETGLYTYAGNAARLDFSGQVWEVQSNATGDWSAQLGTTSNWVIQ